MGRKLASAAPFLVAIACAVVAVVIAGSSRNDRPGTVAPRVAAAPAPPAVDDALSMSRHLPVAEVATHYRDVAMESADAKRVAEFRPLYDEAERTFGVNWRLIASIHRQETAFSAAKSTYHGRNFADCCAGPMQFNVTNGPVSTWQRYRDAFQQGLRPAHYPHRTPHHPSIYDDYDAIMAAGKLLSESGADMHLGRNAWYAAYAYYGHDAFGVTYADQVTARAIGWARHGFCANCDVSPRIIQAQFTRFGAAEHKKYVVAVVKHADKTTKKKPAAKPKRKRPHHRTPSRSDQQRKAAAEEAARLRALQGAARTLGQRVGHRQFDLRPPVVKPSPTPRPTATPTAVTTPTPAASPTTTPGLLQETPGPTG